MKLEKEKVIFIVFLVIFSLIMFFACDKTYDKSSIFTERFTKTELKILQNDAQEINRKSNVSARTRVDTFFELGDAYYYFKQKNLAIDAYKKGLRLRSWDWEYQLKLAILQFEGNNLSDAYEKFHYVVDNSKNKKYVKVAQNYLKKDKFKWMKETDIEIPEKKEYTIILTRFGQVSPQIMETVKNRISEQFKITVKVSEEIMSWLRKGNKASLQIGGLQA